LYPTKIYWIIQITGNDTGVFGALSNATLTGTGAGISLHSGYSFYENLKSVLKILTLWDYLLIFFL
jgi:hypothetical protein